MTRFTTTITAGMIKKGLTLAVVATLVSGCMGNSGGQPGYQVVQEKQFSDPNKKCTALRAEVAQLDQDIAGIDRKIMGASTAGSVLGSLISMGGLNSNQNILADFGRRQTSNESTRLQTIKSSYQTRRNTLFQGYIAKGCNG